MVDAVSAGTLAVVEGLVTSPPAKRMSYISAVAEEDAVVEFFGLRSTPFFLGNTVTGVEAIWFG